MSPLRRPPDPVKLSEFPSYLLRPKLKLFRIHRGIHEPWWFSSDVKCRFALPAPHGTCYLAKEKLGAFVESFQDWVGTNVPVPEIEVSARRISVLRVPYTMKLADCTKARTASFGITGEIHSNSDSKEDRKLTQAWAMAFAQADFHGICYLVRHDPSQRRIGIALFGDAGLAQWSVESTDVIGDDLISDAASVFGIQVMG